MKFELNKKVPIVEIDGKRCLVDTGFPGAFMSAEHGVQEFFGIPGLHFAGVQALKRYTKFDYRNRGATDRLAREDDGRGVEGMRYIDTGAAFSYVHNLSKDFPSAGIADECSFDGRPWTAPMRRVPCEFAGHPFEILCGDARDNKANPNGCAVPPEGVIGYDFFANFTLVVDRIGGKMAFVKN